VSQVKEFGIFDSFVPLQAHVLVSQDRLVDHQTALADVVAKRSYAPRYKDSLKPRAAANIKVGEWELNVDLGRDHSAAYR
jgi:hypothetical protein